jgi:hypothetical protein
VRGEDRGTEPDQPATRQKWRPHPRPSGSSQSVSLPSSQYNPQPQLSRWTWYEPHRPRRRLTHRVAPSYTPAPSAVRHRVPRQEDPRRARSFHECHVARYSCAEAIVPELLTRPRTAPAECSTRAIARVHAHRPIPRRARRICAHGTALDAPRSGRWMPGVVCYGGRKMAATDCDRRGPAALRANPP